MAKRDDVFPDKYVKAATLGGKPLTVTITSTPMETLKNPKGEEQTKTVLHFRETKKLLPLNQTNWDAVASLAAAIPTIGLATKSSFTRRRRRWAANLSTASASGRRRSQSYQGQKLRQRRQPSRCCTPTTIWMTRFPC